MKQIYIRNTALALNALLVLLPGCSQDKLVEEKVVTTTSVETTPFSGTTLVTLRGRPVISLEQFDKEVEQILDRDPQLKQLKPILAANPEARAQLEDQALQGLAYQEVLQAYVTDNNIDKKAEYQKELQEAMRAVRAMLNKKYFDERFPVTIGDAEVRKFYDENKDLYPQFVVSRGGTNARGVQFDKEADARAFLEKVRGKGAQMEAIAKENKFADNFKDFKLVNAQSLALDPVLRDKILAFSALPVLELVKVNDTTFWVVYASGKEETKYRTFDELKENIREFLVTQKQAEREDQELRRLAKEYDLVIKEEILGARRPQAQSAPTDDQQLESQVAPVPQAPGKVGKSTTSKPAGASRVA
ncbi:peptidyl-prolyl cis-trans isomerase [Vermiphilus pyriformis]|nr:MAG: peptidyl-prolyl cis-trans isomerase [Vermiphilus pyriformis]